MHLPRIATVVALSITSLLAVPSIAGAQQLSAPIFRDGNVGTARAYFGIANGWGVFEPRIVDFEPPKDGERYSVWIRLSAGCDGEYRTVNSRARTARLTGPATLFARGVLMECDTIGSTVEIKLFVRRVSTGTIVGRSNLFSAG